MRRGRVVRPAREVTAVTYRLGCKRVLLATRRLAAAHLARWTQQQQAQAQAQVQQQAQQRRPQPPQGRSSPGVAAAAKEEAAAAGAESLVEDLPEVVPAPTEEEAVAVGVSARGAQEEVAPREEPQPRSGKKPKKKRKSDSAKQGGGSL